MPMTQRVAPLTDLLHWMMQTLVMPLYVDSKVATSLEFNGADIQINALRIAASTFSVWTGNLIQGHCLASQNVSKREYGFGVLVRRLIPKTLLEGKRFPHSLSKKSPSNPDLFHKWS